MLEPIEDDDQDIKEEITYKIGPRKLIIIRNTINNIDRHKNAIHYENRDYVS